MSQYNAGEENALEKVPSFYKKPKRYVQRPESACYSTG